jgi:divalent metal cation (Fe/Co/Zn/Cd) transporter
MDVHDLAERVEYAVEKVVACKATVHGDPVDRSHKMYETVAVILERATQQDRRLASFHDLRLTDTESGFNVSADIVVSNAVRESEYEMIGSSVRDILKREFPLAGEIDLGIEQANAGGAHYVSWGKKPL